MPILLVLAAIAVLALVFGPMLWTRSLLAKHAADRPDFPGTGGELARHLLDLHGLGQVTVEPTERGDHYDPRAKAVRLTKGNFNGRSVTAIVVAAHEVGHALQDADGDVALRTRTALARTAAIAERIGGMVMVAAPVLGLITRAPAVGLLTVGAGILTLLIGVIVHLVTLPVEFDASFRKAMPLLRRGGYLPPEELPNARRILRACALTYVASSLSSLLNLARWVRFVR